MLFDEFDVLFFNSSFAAGEALQSDPPLEVRISMAQAM